ncbi:putative methyltransferase PMT16 [Prunus yedoensis var. nudiflora]|uniref:Methyltransferase n=1 Tax=Prunus yedoensis var. nudiflora TaxID=2094558 RepID=A0A314UB83_PRUYE|nr:putative methyltransferase PMT16 [Prunus yedoensis var. nudiflora]
MASNDDRPYHPTSKPSKPSLFPWKKPNVYTLPVVLFLCICSYFFGLWQHGGTSTPTFKLPCKSSNQIHPATTTSTTQSPTLDFSSHHTPNLTAATSSHAVKPKAYPPCDVKFSEYTPCEDAKRSLKFDRDRLIYRERHCPEKNDLLKCRVPAPHGYKTVFSWPMSRDLAWYANVPHKELTVEKAVQNWIIYEGDRDRLRFPGGGTMFPNGADAYIDDIGKLINLKDGSIRTAIDTGCGVSTTQLAASLIFVYLLINLDSVFP